MLSSYPLFCTRNELHCLVSYANGNSTVIVTFYEQIFFVFDKITIDIAAFLFFSLLCPSSADILSFCWISLYQLLECLGFSNKLHF